MHTAGGGRERGIDAIGAALERGPLRPLYASLRGSVPPGDALLGRVEDYVARWLEASGRTAEEAAAAYQRFLQRYVQDVEHFAATGAYPARDTTEDPPFARWEYDATLLLSVLVSEHRYRIMALTASQAVESGRIAVVGAGAGLELELLDRPGCEAHGWDLELSEAIARLHPRVDLHEGEFPEGVTGSFDRIFLIELLEHVRDPWKVLGTCARALRSAGRIVLTTATNIPQFDHVYNFPADHAGFRRRAGMLGLRVEEEIDIPHRSLARDIGSRNRFFVLAADAGGAARH